MLAGVDQFRSDGRGVVTVGTDVPSGLAGASTIYAPTFGLLTNQYLKNHQLSKLLSSGTVDLLVQIENSDAHGGQDFFSSIAVESGSGAFRVFASRDAVYGTMGGLHGIWFWGSGSNRVYALADGGKTLDFAVYAANPAG